MPCFLSKRIISVWVDGVLSQSLPVNTGISQDFTTLSSQYQPLSLFPALTVMLLPADLSTTLLLTKPLPTWIGIVVFSVHYSLAIRDERLLSALAVMSNLMLPRIPYFLLHSHANLCFSLLNSEPTSHTSESFLLPGSYMSSFLNWSSSVPTLASHVVRSWFSIPRQMLLYIRQPSFIPSSNPTDT